jgi:hypothetical protein
MNKAETLKDKEKILYLVVAIEKYLWPKKRTIIEL